MNARRRSSRRVYDSRRKAYRGQCFPASQMNSTSAPTTISSPWLASSPAPIKIPAKITQRSLIISVPTARPPAPRPQRAAFPIGWFNFRRHPGANTVIPAPAGIHPALNNKRRGNCHFGETGPGPLNIPTAPATGNACRKYERHSPLAGLICPAIPVTGTIILSPVPSSRPLTRHSGSSRNLALSSPDLSPEIGATTAQTSCTTLLPE